MPILLSWQLEKWSSSWVPISLLLNRANAIMKFTETREYRKLGQQDSYSWALNPRMTKWSCVCLSWFQKKETNRMHQGLPPGSCKNWDSSRWRSGLRAHFQKLLLEMKKKVRLDCRQQCWNVPQVAWQPASCRMGWSFPFVMNPQIIHLHSASDQPHLNSAFSTQSKFHWLKTPQAQTFMKTPLVSDLSVTDNR